MKKICFKYGTFSFYLPSWRYCCQPGSRHRQRPYFSSTVLAGGLSLESLSDPAGLLRATHPRSYAGQQRVDYGGTPTLAARVCYTEETVFDDVCLKAFDGVLDGEARVSQLRAAGYVQVDKMPAVGTDSDKVWVARRGLTEWHDLTGFYLPSATRDTLLTGKTTLTWDAAFCVVTAVKDAAGLTTTARYDYRFMTPWQLTDASDNVTEVLTDALGRVVATSFYGKEAGKPAGFNPVSTFKPTPRALASLADNLVTTLGVASWTASPPAG